MRIEHQPAFVLHDRPYRETSLLVEAYTRDHGRIGLVARGVRTAKPRIARASLAPLQPVVLSWTGRGELPTLSAAEPVGRALRPEGEALLGALYLNELLVRLLPRGDAHPELFARYGACLEALADEDAPAWTLRRFERDALAELGYALELTQEADGGPTIDPARDYSYDPERGAVPWSARPIAPRIAGAALQALAGEQAPDAATLRSLRGLMRAILRHHLGGRELNAWHLFAGPRPG